MTTTLQRASNEFLEQEFGFDEGMDFETYADYTCVPHATTQWCDAVRVFGEEALAKGVQTWEHTDTERHVERYWVFDVDGVPVLLTSQRYTQPAATSTMPKESIVMYSADQATLRQLTK